MSDLSLGGLRAVLDFSQQLWFDPDALVRNTLRESLRLPDQRLQTLLQVGGRGFIKFMVDFAGVDQVVALATADVEAVPLRAVKRKAGDGQGLPLRARLFDPVVAASGRKVLSRTFETTPSRPTLDATALSRAGGSARSFIRHCPRTRDGAGFLQRG